MPKRQTWNTLRHKLSSYLDLKPNWNSYGADSPKETTVIHALNFMYLLELVPILAKLVSVAPSVIGGIGLTIKGVNTKVYVEFCNTGKHYALFSDGYTEPKIQEFVTLDYYKIITAIRKYLEI